MWIILHLVMIVGLGVIVWNVLQDYEHTPVVTVVDSDHYPSNLLDLPGEKENKIHRFNFLIDGIFIINIGYIERGIRDRTDVFRW